MKTKTKLNNRYQIETPDGFVDFDGVGKIKVKQQLIRFILINKEKIDVTLNHIFVINGLDIQAIFLKVGDCLDTKIGLVKIKKIKKLFIKREVYTPLQVNSINNTYYSNDIVSKNCKFLGSNSTLIDPDVLESLYFDEPIDIKWNGLMSIYKLPEKNKKYIVGCDTAGGSGRDYSVIQVLEYSSQCSLEQVATYRCNLIRPKEFSQVCVMISSMYNNSYIMVENNDVGSLVANEIWYNFECDRLLNLDPKGLGIRSTKQTKLRANMLLKEYLEKGYLVLHDKRTIDEIGMYEEVSDSLKNNVYAVLNDHDDCVTSLLWALYFVLTDYFDGEIVVEGMEKKFRVNEDGSLKDDDDDDSDGGPVMVFDE